MEPEKLLLLQGFFKVDIFVLILIKSDAPLFISINLFSLQSNKYM